MTRLARPLAAAAVVIVAAAAVAGCGGSGGESAAAFAKRITTEFSRGQSGRLWESLLPSQQAIVTKGRFLTCQGNQGFGLRTIKVLDTYGEGVDVEGRNEDSTAVTLQVTSDEGRTTATMHAIRTGGGWHWILSTAQMAAYTKGKCP
jgi:hypothetical protein